MNENTLSIQNSQFGLTCVRVTFYRRHDNELNLSIKIITSRLMCVYKPVYEAYIQGENIELNQLPLIYFTYGKINLMIENIIKIMMKRYLRVI